jgi:hypothetical protein
MPFIFTTQQPVQADGPLAADVFNLLPLTDEERCKIFRTYHPGPLTDAATTLTSVCATPYELSLAAVCADEAGRIDSQAALFDAYVRKHCERTSNPALVRSILDRLAAHMQDALTGSLLMAEAWRLGQEVIDREGGRTPVLDELFHSGLLDVRQGRCAFRHERLEQFFQAESLLRSTAGPDALVAALATPRYRPLARFLLGLLTDGATASACLVSLADTAIIVDCLQNRCGSLPHGLVMQACRHALMTAERSLEETEAALPDGDGWHHLEVTTGGDWNPFARAVFAAIGRAISHGTFLEDAFRLARATEERCLASLAAPANGFLSRKDAARLFSSQHVCYSSNGGAILPATIIFHALQDAYGENPDVTERIIRLALPLADRTATELAWLCKLLPRCANTAPDIIPDLICTCWRTGFYHLQLDALQLAQQFRSRLDGDLLRRVRELLGGLSTKNLMLNTAIIDALCVFDMVESPVEPADASAQLDAVLRDRDDAKAQQLAYSIVGNVFEDIYQGVYFNAVQQLALVDRVQLYTMAALGAPDYGWHTDWILAELVRLNNAIALPAFLRWAKGPDPNSVAMQEAVARYLWAIRGLAEWLPSFPPADWACIDSGRAWAAYGEILFWSFKPDVHAPAKSAITAAWARLLTELSFEAVGPLHEMERAIWTVSDDFKPVHMLCSLFPEEVRRLLEFAIRNRDHPDRFGPYFRFGDSLASFAARTLAEVGDLGTIRLFAPLADDLEVGAQVVEAVRRIRERVG